MKFTYLSFVLSIAVALVSSSAQALDIPVAQVEGLKERVEGAVLSAIGDGKSDTFGPANNLHWRVSFQHKQVQFPNPLSITCNDEVDCAAFLQALSGRWTITATLPVRVSVRGTFKAWGWSISDIDGDFELHKTIDVRVTMPIQWNGQKVVPIPEEGTVVFDSKGGNVDVDGLIGDGARIGTVTVIVAPWTLGISSLVGGIGGAVAEGKIEDYIKKKFTEGLQKAAVEQAEALLALAASNVPRIVGLAVASLLGMSQ